MDIFIGGWGWVGVSGGIFWVGGGGCTFFMGSGWGCGGVSGAGHSFKYNPILNFC